MLVRDNGAEKSIEVAARIALIVAALIALSLLIASGHCAAAVDLFAVDGHPVTLAATLQNREEVWNWFEPQAIKGGAGENQYHFLNITVLVIGSESAPDTNQAM